MALTAGNRIDNKSNISSKLPRLSTSIWLLIVCAVILIIAVPLSLSLYGSISAQSSLRTQLTQLQTRYNDLQKQTGAQAALLAEVDALKQDLDKTGRLYRDVDSSIEVSQELIDAAWQCDVVINSMTVSQAKYKYSGTEFPVLNYAMSLSGQVAAFQNFLLEVGKRLPSSHAVDVIIEPADSQGKLDKASITIRVVCDKK